MRDLIEKLYEDVRERAKAHHVPTYEAVKVFFEGYEHHKAMHGSFRDHPQYFDVMKGRYLFMHDRAIKFIENYEVKK